MRRLYEGAFSIRLDGVLVNDVWKKRDKLEDKYNIKFGKLIRTKNGNELKVTGKEENVKRFYNSKDYGGREGAEDNRRLFDEGHDFMNAEVKSNDLTRKAAHTGPRAKSRKGDKHNIKMKRDVMKKHKFMEVTDVLDTLDDDHIAIIAEMFATHDPLDEIVSMQDSLDELISEEDGIDPEFKAQLATIMEIAVKARVREECDIMEQAFDERLEEEVQVIVERIDNYLPDTVNEWIEDNQIAIERSVKSDLAENFIDDLKALFETYSIDTPEGEAVLESIGTERDELIDENNELVEELMVAHDTIEENERLMAVSDVSEGLTDLESDKLLELSETLDFNNPEDFREQLTYVREHFLDGYTMRGATNRNESLYENTDHDYDGTGGRATSSRMGTYLNASNKLNRKTGRVT